MNNENWHLSSINCRTTQLCQQTISGHLILIHWPVGPQATMHWRSLDTCSLVGQVGMAHCRRSLSVLPRSPVLWQSCGGLVTWPWSGQCRLTPHSACTSPRGSVPPTSLRVPHDTHTVYAYSVHIHTVYIRTYIHTCTHTHFLRICRHSTNKYTRTPSPLPLLNHTCTFASFYTFP